VIATNTPTPALPVQKAEARHRVHARVEDFIRCGKNTGLASPPSWSFAINQAWCAAAAIACDLAAWLRLLCLDGELALAEPDTLRYALLHTSAKIVRGQRKRTLKIPRTRPWAHQLANLIGTALALPNPTRPPPRCPLDARKETPPARGTGVTGTTAGTSPHPPKKMKIKNYLDHHAGRSHHTP
jgi:hypothetical protein